MKVVVHLGHRKTGSSYLQVCLAAKSKELEQQGVIYPVSQKQVQVAQKGIFFGHPVTSWREVLKKTKQYVSKAEFTNKTILFSHEHFYKLLANDTYRLEELSKLGVDVELIVFSRCPMEYLQSGYAQDVKNFGYYGSIEDFLQENNYKIDLVQNMANLIEAADRLHIPIHVHNYSKRKKDILSLVENHLDVPKGTLQPEQDNMVINRTLTPDEVLLVRAYNKFLGKKTSKIIAQPLNTNLPELKAHKIRPEKQALDKFIMNMNNDIEAFNKKYGQMFDAYDRLNANDVEGVESPECATLSPQQLEVVASAVANHLQMQKFPHSVKQFKLKKLKPKFLRAKWKPLMRVYGRDM